MLAMRQAAAERYMSLFAGVSGLELPPAHLPGSSISWFVFVVRLRDQSARDQAQSALAGRRIATGRYFAPVHLQPAYRHHPSANVSLPNTEYVAHRTLAIPLFNRITDLEQTEIAEVLARILIS
jgi:perosamine synthetase